MCVFCLQIVGGGAGCEKGKRESGTVFLKGNWHEIVGELDFTALKSQVRNNKNGVN